MIGEVEINIVYDSEDCSDKNTNHLPSAWHTPIIDLGQGHSAFIHIDHRTS